MCAADKDCFATDEIRIFDKFEELTTQEEAELDRSFSLCCLCYLMLVILIVADNRLGCRAQPALGSPWFTSTG
jgi:hypothetical protein